MFLTLLFVPGAFGYQTVSPDASMVLVGNTRGHNVVAFSLKGAYLGEVLKAEDPDHLQLYDGSLYVSVGAAVVKCEVPTLEVVSVDCSPFAIGGGLSRPRGFVFGDDGLYVSSYDAILKFDANNGTFLEVFAKGTDFNHLALDDHKLYATTQGQKIFVFDLETKTKKIFVDDVEPIGVSLLGIRIFDQDVWVSDFAGGGIRNYDKSSKALIDTYSTTFTNVTHYVGSFDLIDDDTLVAVAFVDDQTNWPGVLLTYDISSGDSQSNFDPSRNFLLRQEEDNNLLLKRPVGCLVI